MNVHPDVPTNPAAEDRLSRLQEIHATILTICTRLKLHTRVLVIVIVYTPQKSSTLGIMYQDHTISRPLDLAVNWITNVLALT